MIEGQIAAGLKNYRFGTDKAWKKKRHLMNSVILLSNKWPQMVKFYPYVSAELEKFFSHQTGMQS